MIIAMYILATPSRPTSAQCNTLQFFIQPVIRAPPSCTHARSVAATAACWLVSLHCAAEGTLLTMFSQVVNITNVPDDLTEIDFESADVELEFDTPDAPDKVCVLANVGCRL